MLFSDNFMGVLSSFKRLENRWAGRVELFSNRDAEALDVFSSFQLYVDGIKPRLTYFMAVCEPRQLMGKRKLV
uniref:Uncharacterized protein n=1 Tax=Glossina pallidipes TaxID=7398 RepID=A0A1B0AJT8_GLOPL